MTGAPLPPYSRKLSSSSTDRKKTCLYSCAPQKYNETQVSKAGYHDMQNVDAEENCSFVKKQPKVAIFLGTFEGEKFLEEQLESINCQGYKNWTIYASDDCSSDNTLSVLKDFQENGVGKLIIQSNKENKGFTANFLSLVCDPKIQADLYAFSDQDDIWEPHKLQRAVNWIKDIPEDVPALYCSRTITVNENNVEEGLSPLFSKQPSFANALVQSIGGGNTMLFNNKARDLLVEAGTNVKIACHDWWAYILVTGCGGKVFYDRRPSIRYRQHGKNYIGSNNSLLARYKRICMLFQDRFKNWNRDHINSLSSVKHRLTSENLNTFNLFIKSREETLFKRLINLKKSKVYRQTLLGNLGLYAACMLKKL